MATQAVTEAVSQTEIDAMRRAVAPSGSPAPRRHLPALSGSSPYAPVGTRPSAVRRTTWMTGSLIEREFPDALFAEDAALAVEFFRRGLVDQVAADAEKEN